MDKSCANCGKESIDESALICPECGCSEWDEASRPVPLSPRPAVCSEAPEPSELRPRATSESGQRITAVQGDHSTIEQSAGPCASAAQANVDGVQKVVAAQGDDSTLIQGSGNYVHHGETHVHVNYYVIDPGGVSVSPETLARLGQQLASAKLPGVPGPKPRLEPADEPMAALDNLSQADPTRPQLVYTSGRGLMCWDLGHGEGPMPYMVTDRSIGTLGWSAGESGKAHLLLGYRYGFYDLDIATCDLRDRPLPDTYDLGRSHGFSGVAPLPAGGGFLSSHRQFGIWRFPSGTGEPQQVLACGSMDDPAMGPGALHTDWEGSLCFACGAEYRIAPPPFVEVTRSLVGDGSRIRAAAVIRQETMRVAVTAEGALLGWYEGSAAPDMTRDGDYQGLCVVDMADDTVIFAGRPEAIDVLTKDFRVLRSITGVAQMRRPKTMRVIPPYLAVIDDTHAYYSTLFVFDLRTWEPMRVGNSLAVVRTSIPVFDGLLLPSEIM